MYLLFVSFLSKYNFYFINHINFMLIIISYSPLAALSFKPREVCGLFTKKMIYKWTNWLLYLRFDLFYRNIISIFTLTNKFYSFYLLPKLLFYHRLNLSLYQRFDLFYQNNISIFLSTNKIYFSIFISKIIVLSLNQSTIVSTFWSIIIKIIFLFFYQLIKFIPQYLLAK